MRLEQQKLVAGHWQIANTSDGFNPEDCQLVLGFGSGELIASETAYAHLQKSYPAAQIVLCSTAGEVLETEVSDGTLAVTAIEFERTHLHVLEADIEDAGESFSSAEVLAKQLPLEDLGHAMVFSDGLKVNGSELVKGIKGILPQTVSLTGGLAGDGAQFLETRVGLNSPGQVGKIVLIGFYGEDLVVGHGSMGGWDSFGAKRVVTKSEGNVVYELDGQPVLDLYKHYLGDMAADLPGSGLLFPLKVQMPDKDYELVRTMLAVDEEAKSVTFAGDVPEGSMAQLMKANFDRLIDGAEAAAEQSNLDSKSAELAILISCVGRKLILKQRTEEEVEAVSDMLGDKTQITGFYSYGEIAPTAAQTSQCDLHNQTMTITTFAENGS